jgi:peroxiredoxin
MPSKILRSKLPLIVGATTALLVGAAVVLNLNQPMAVGVKSNSYNIKDVPRHPVTEQMEVDAKSFLGKDMPEFELKNERGELMKSADFVGEKPAVLIMTKDGCPCSIESQPYWTSMAKHYRESAKFFAMIDTKPAGGLNFKDDFGVPYPILSSETDQVFRQFGAKQSVYIYLMNRDGKVEAVWPGYSRSMLQELNKRLSELTGTEAQQTDFGIAPEEMTSGCYFFMPVGTEKPAW